MSGSRRGLGRHHRERRLQVVRAEKLPGLPGARPIDHRHSQRGRAGGCRLRERVITGAVSAEPAKRRRHVRAGRFNRTGIVDSQVRPGGRVNDDDGLAVLDGTER